MLYLSHYYQPAMHYNKFFFTAAFLGFILSSNQASGQCVSVLNGAWSNPSTWSCGNPGVSRVPVCTDVPITIAAGFTVQITNQHDYSGCGSYMIVIVDGVMNFPANGPKLRLPEGSFIYGNGNITTTATSGSGNANFIEIGNTVVWSKGDGPVNGPFQFPENQPLPIDLLSFYGLAGEDAVQFNWVVASEVNNDYFIIERSPDMATWTAVHTQTGSGNSNQVRTYRGQDASPENGLMYYRLSQTDFDGTREVFDPIAVQYKSGGGKNQSPTLYPNPLNLSTREALYIANLNFDIERFTITDLNGRAIQKNELSQNSSIPSQIKIDYPEFRPGIYYVIVEGSFGTKTAKLLVH